MRTGRFCVTLTHMQGALSVVATPIGNLEDITLRAIRILTSADLVLCEDTRVTKKLLAHYDISTPCMSYHEHSGHTKHEKVTALLAEGKHLALVSDAGTPGVSDPGVRLVEHVRASLAHDVHIETIPGPSALVAALAIAGVPTEPCTFWGFPPHKKGRKTFFDTLADYQYTSVFYESPHRLVRALTALHERVDASAHVVVCRELTKVHECVVSGTAEEVLAYYAEHTDEVRGECVVIVVPHMAQH